MVTERLYYADSYIKSFSAAVVSCNSCDSFYCTVLDKTAFFPEGGGQKADTGYIGNIFVYDVLEKDGEIYHYTKEPLEVNSVYECSIDWDTRFKRMQSHSGEHIISGIVCGTYGFNNVGFHMDEDHITIDFDRELSKEQIKDVEIKANKIIYDNRVIKCYFPSEDVLPTLEYRSKLDLTEDVRIVDIDGVDVCACCAPHVNKTGEIGIIKILDSMRHRGGVRLTVKCGFDAFMDYFEKYSSVQEISCLLSSKQCEVVSSVERVISETDKCKREFFAFKQRICEEDIDSLSFVNGVSYFISSYYDSDMMRFLANHGMTVSELSIILSGDDENGYSYIIASESVDLSQFAKKINSALNGRGGGRGTMIQGKILANRKEISDFLNNLDLE